MENAATTQINILIPRKKNHYDDICLSTTKSGQRCKNKRSNKEPFSHFCLSHKRLVQEPIQILSSLCNDDEIPTTDFYDDLGSLGLDAKEINIWCDGKYAEHDEFMTNWHKKTRRERALFFEELLKDTPLIHEKMKASTWSPATFHWNKCDECQIYSLKEAGGCRSCKLFKRMIELPSECSTI